MSTTYDILIAGGGPAGSTSGLILARAGYKVCIVEKDRHPRFHIGESILPRTTGIIQDLGLEAALAKLPQVPKYGAEFGMGNDLKTRCFSFTDGLIPGAAVFNIERSHFDKMLLDEARAAGAEVREGAPIKELTHLAHGDVRAQTTSGEVRAKLLLDCSGHGTIVGRKLGIRRDFSEPALRKVAYFEHFDHVERYQDERSGHPCIIMCDEGWFWLIGLTKTRTSIGFVTRPSFVKDLNVPPTQLLSWAIARCPVVRHRMRDATGPAENRILSNFSYRCRPYAGDGYFMVGDAACFLDPIFSTGVTLAMVNAQHTAGLVDRVLKGTLAVQKARRQHIAFVDSSTAPFWSLIRAYYQHSFRELFMEGQGPFQMQRAIISILAGQVFPKPAWSLRWRRAAFGVCVQLQKHFNLVPRRKPCRLVQETPTDLPWLAKPSGGAAHYEGVAEVVTRPASMSASSVAS